MHYGTYIKQYLTVTLMYYIVLCIPQLHCGKIQRFTVKSEKLALGRV